MLTNKLKKFVNGKLDVDQEKTTARELRKVYKPQDEIIKSKNLMFQIFNSIWNRIPNFDILGVLKDKLDYAFRIGVGIASYNQLPLSWIVDSSYKENNFLMKDRGHITTLIKQLKIGQMITFLKKLCLY